MRLSLRHRAIRAVTLATALALPLAFAPPAGAQAGPVSDVFAKLLEKTVTGKNVKKHLNALQAIATANGGNRAVGTSGYDASLNYVADKLRKAGYKISTSPVEFPLTWEELSAPVLEQVSPTPTTYNTPADFVTVHSSGSGDVTAEVQVIDPVLPPTPTPSSTAGCEASDWAGFVPGRIALIQRGTCPFKQKADNAKAAGAAAVIFFNEGQPGRTDPYVFDIGEWRYGFPVMFAGFAVGNALAGTPGVRLHVKTDTKTVVGKAKNLLAESRFGDPDDVVMVGAHLDSVPAGPGINDNGSGTAAILETALQMKLFPVRNKVRFAFWGAEELGLLGSAQYVEQLSQAERDRIRLYLNFDMVASTNFAYKLYDGDNSDNVGSPAGPPGSAQIEKQFEKFYGKRNLATVGTDFDGRSDYGPFIANGIPAGGIFTGAEGIKTAAEATLFGGTAGAPYDPCYHQACDNISNISDKALDVNSDAIAVSTATYAFDLSSIPRRAAGAAATTLRSLSAS
ncbi:M28 family metallopeptidase [Spongiactinospora sp. TRM90649]|uniref:M28 family metallopeptidase n=1 Tax=Spongiactinospora sp. TRM90649 TaxID=3031114 RepID=UPI0023F975A3|nr:M28 family metallopeptidase [Spongiactinospora sp. TRM90649]MDF5751893.1 M28 family metallopeptidase [Spongiactinospora sp. TRM90649]